MKLSNAVIPIVIGDWFNAYGIVRSFYDEGIKTILLSHKKKTFIKYSRFLSGFGVIPDADSNQESMISELVLWGKRISPRKGMIFVTCDSDLIAVVKNREVLKRYFLLPYSELDTCMKALDKRRFSEICSKLEIPTIKEYLVENEMEAYDLISQFDFPVFIKPVKWDKSFVEKFGGKNILITEHRQYEEFVSLFYKSRSESSFLLQEYIEESEVYMPTVKGLGDGEGGNKFIFIAEKIHQYPIGRGGSLLMRAVDPQDEQYIELIGYTERIIKELGFFGLFGIEYKYDPKEKIYKVVEMNPRSEQLNYLPTLCGQNASVGLYYYMQGIDIQIPYFPKIYVKSSVVPLMDFVSMCIVARLRKEKKISVKEWKKQRGKNYTMYGLSIKDPLPFFMYYLTGLLRIPNVLFRILCGVPNNMSTFIYLRSKVL